LVNQQRISCSSCGYINLISSKELKNNKAPICGNCANHLTNQVAHEPRIFAPVVEAKYITLPTPRNGSLINKLFGFLNYLKQPTNAN